MIDKAVGVLIDAFRGYYSARSRFARKIKRLATALQNCNAAWRAFSGHNSFMPAGDPKLASSVSQQDQEQLTVLSEAHRLAVAQLADALKDLDFMLEVFSPEAKAALQGYAGLEAVVHPKDGFDGYVHRLIDNSTPAEFEAASKSLNDYIRSAFKPEELL